MRIIGWISGYIVLAVALWVTAAAPRQGNAQIAAPAAPQVAPPIAAPAGANAPAILQPPHDKAALLPIEGPVDSLMEKSLVRRIDEARKAGCTLIIYDLDSYQGVLSSGLAIAKMTRALPGEHIGVVAWVHGRAYSAAAIAAVACQQIVMARDATLGDIATLQPGNGSVTLPVLADLDASAKQNGLTPAVLQAMAVPKIELDEMQNKQTGEHRVVAATDKRKLLNTEVALPGGGKMHPWVFVQTLDTSSQVFTADAATAASIGLSKGAAENLDELRPMLNIRGDVVRLDLNWPERATRFLTQDWVRFFLFVGMLVFAWVEFSHPGLSVAGALAVTCLILLAGAPFIAGVAQTWELVLIVIGLAIVIADLFFIGSLGMLAVPGFLLMAIGLIATFVPAEPGGSWVPTLSSTWTAVRDGTMVVVFGSAASVVAFFVLAKYLYVAPGFQHLRLEPGITPEGYGSVRDTADRSTLDAVFLGAIGVAATDLRPAGKVRFGDHLVDVVSFGSYVENGTEVEVTEVAGSRVTVRPRPEVTRGADAARNVPGEPA